MQFTDENVQAAVKMAAEYVKTGSNVAEAIGITQNALRAWYSPLADDESYWIEVTLDLVDAVNRNAL